MLKLNVEETIAQKMKKKKMIIQVPVLSFSFPLITLLNLKC